MCEISNSKIQRFQSWYFPDKPYSVCIFSRHYGRTSLFKFKGEYDNFLGFPYYSHT